MMRRALGIALALLALHSPAHAGAVADVTPGPWVLYRGTAIVQPRVNHPDLGACVEQAKALGVARSYTCRNSAAVVVSILPDPPSCGEQPATETQTVQCPAGTTGSWLQSRTYGSAPAPTCWTPGEWFPATAPAGACTPVVGPPPPPPVDGVSTTFDALYAAGFTLKALDNAAIVQQPRPAKSTSVNAPSYTDPAYGTKVFKITDTATDGNVANVSHIRHDYSRRQAFNADSSRYLAQDGNGFWALFDGNTFKRIPGKRSNGMLAGLAGDAEPFWHPTDPNVLWWWGGGLTWYAKDVRTDTDTVLVNFTGRLPWAQAAQVWTKSEGVPSADGRFWGLMATRYDSATQRNVIYGLLVWDRETDTIKTLDASAFGGAFPDHVSMSPSGKYIVPSWAYDRALGTRAYTRDFASWRMLHTMSEHSDLAFGSNGEDMYVVTDYDAGQVRAVNMDTGASINLLPIYPVSGAGYAAHVSGKAYKRPGWVVVSTYADSSNYGATKPASPQQGVYRKLMAVELKAGGRVLNIAHTQSGADYGGYFGEHQATVNLDFTRVVWAANFGAGTRIESVMVGLPSTAIGR